MFYSTVILTKKGTLGQIWIAAHWENKLTKKQIKDIVVSKSVQDIETPPVALSLRLTAHLLLGITRIFRKKVAYLQIECEESTARIFTTIKQNINDADVVTARDEDINMNQNKFVDDTLDFDISLDMNQEMGNWSNIENDPDALKSLFNVTTVEYSNSINTSIEQARDASSLLNISGIQALDDEFYPPSAIDMNLSTNQSKELNTMSLLDNQSVLPPLPEDNDIETARRASSMLQRESMSTINNNTAENASINGKESLIQTDFFEGPAMFDIEDTNQRISLSLNQSAEPEPSKRTKKQKQEKNKRKVIVEDGTLEYPEQFFKRRQTKKDMETRERESHVLIDSAAYMKTSSAYFYDVLQSYNFSSSIQSFVTDTVLVNLQSRMEREEQERVQQITKWRPSKEADVPMNNSIVEDYEFPSFQQSFVDRQSVGKRYSMYIYMLSEMNGYRLDRTNMDMNNENDESVNVRQTKQIEEFKQVLNETIEKNENKPVSWNHISKNASKKTAARCFFALLMLKSNNQFEVKQNEPYSDIVISKPN